MESLVKARIVLLDKDGNGECKKDATLMPLAQELCMLIGAYAQSCVDGELDMSTALDIARGAVSAAYDGRLEVEDNEQPEE